MKQLSRSFGIFFIIQRGVLTKVFEYVKYIVHMTSNVTIDQTTHTTTQSPARRSAVAALATVGFIALLILGITLAIYSARYIPIAISKLTGPKTSSETPVLVVSSTTPPNNSGMIVSQTTTTVPPTSSPVIAAVVTAPATVHPVTSKPTPTEHVSHASAPYGLPDLSVSIIATGYLTTESTDSFVPANIIPPGARPAVKFSIANVGTNSTGPWNFLAMIPSINNNVFSSPIEPSLNPGDHTVFTLGFNQAIPGPAQTITVQADPGNTINESNEGNNSASAAVTIIQTGN